MAKEYENMTHEADRVREIARERFDAALKRLPPVFVGTIKEGHARVFIDTIAAALQAQGEPGWRALREANFARQQEWDLLTSGVMGGGPSQCPTLERERIGIRGSRATPEQLAEELADVVVCVDLIAMHVGLDLGKAVADKFNATSEKYGLATRLAGSPPAGGR